ncbi:MAG: hypothetical protein IJV95_03790 [Clostridia bacterium]|nr:hypothetical protein [Clostridia bacterium]
MLFWKRKWKKELDKIVPELDSKILSSVSKNAQVETETKTRQKIKWLPRIIGVAVAFVICCVALVLTLTPPDITVANAAVVVEINPAIAFTVKDGKVETVKSLNQDADIIVSDDNFINSVIGISTDTATKVFVDAAVKYGFIDYSDAAVRISTYGNVNAKKITDEVEDYLLSTGIPSIVFSRALDKNGFKELVGINGSDDVIKELQSTPELFLTRKLTGKTEQELIELYQNDVVKGNVVNFATDMISAFKKKESCIARMEEINHQIEEINFFSYWASINIDNGNTELALLKKEMENLIDEYYKLSGVFINDYEKFMECNYYYISFEEEMASLEEMISSLDEFSVIVNKLNKIFGVEGLVGLLETPKTLEEYVLKLKDSYLYLRDAKLSVNVLEYTKPREPINKNDNDVRVEGIKNEHGTLENFWKHKIDKKN